MRYERSDSGLRGWRVLVDADEVRVASGKTVPYPTWIGFIEESGKIHVWTPAAYTPRGYRAAAREMLEQAKAELLGSRDNPRRPPKQWMRDCVAGASGSATDPGAVCGALWYRKMSPAAKRAALAREGRAENPVATVYHESGSFRDGTLHVYKKIYGSLSAAKKGAREHSSTVDGYVTVMQKGIEVAQFLRGKEVPYRKSNPAWAKVFG